MKRSPTKAEQRATRSQGAQPQGAINPTSQPIAQEAAMENITTRSSLPIPVLEQLPTITPASGAFSMPSTPAVPTGLRPFHIPPGLTNTPGATEDPYAGYAYLQGKESPREKENIGNPLPRSGASTPRSVSSELTAIMKAMQEDRLAMQEQRRQDQLDRKAEFEQHRQSTELLSQRQSELFEMLQHQQSQPMQSGKEPGNNHAAFINSPTFIPAMDPRDVLSPSDPRSWLQPGYLESYPSDSYQPPQQARTIFDTNIFPQDAMRHHNTGTPGQPQLPPRPYDARVGPNMRHTLGDRRPTNFPRQSRAFEDDRQQQRDDQYLRDPSGGTINTLQMAPIFKEQLDHISVSTVLEFSKQLAKFSKNNQNAVVKICNHLTVSAVQRLQCRDMSEAEAGRSLGTFADYCSHGHTQASNQLCMETIQKMLTPRTEIALLSVMKALVIFPVSANQAITSDYDVEISNFPRFHTEWLLYVHSYFEAWDFLTLYYKGPYPYIHNSMGVPGQISHMMSKIPGEFGPYLTRAIHHDELKACKTMKEFCILINIVVNRVLSLSHLVKDTEDLLGMSKSRSSRRSSDAPKSYDASKTRYPNSAFKQQASTSIRKSQWAPRSNNSLSALGDPNFRFESDVIDPSQRPTYDDGSDIVYGSSYVLDENREWPGPVTPTDDPISHDDNDWEPEYHAQLSALQDQAAMQVQPRTRIPGLHPNPSGRVLTNTRVGEGSPNDPAFLPCFRLLSGQECTRGTSCKFNHDPKVLFPAWSAHATKLMKSPFRDLSWTPQFSSGQPTPRETPRHQHHLSGNEDETGSGSPSS